MNKKNIAVCMTFLFFGIFQPLTACTESIWANETQVSSCLCCDIAVLTLAPYSSLQKVACCKPCTCILPVFCFGCCGLRLGDELPVQAPALHESLITFSGVNPMFKNKPSRLRGGLFNAQLAVINEDPEER